MSTPGFKARLLGGPPLITAAGERRSAAAISTVELVVAVLVAALGSVFATWAMGRDLNWDYINYHGYAAVSALQSRVGQDFFAAGYQGYLNPLPFLPLALMQAAGWHTLAISAVLAVIHSLNYFFLYLVAREVCATSPHSVRQAVVLSLLGASSLAALGQVGSTFADPLTTWPVLAAIWLLLRHPPGDIVSVLAMMLAGASTALKWTNAPYALAICLAVFALALPAGAVSALRRSVIAGLGGIAGFCLLYSAWGIQLQAAYGSPVFPLFNGVFGAGDAEQHSVALDRFVPQSWQAVVTLPLRMMTHESWIYTEVVSPDLRPVLLLTLLVTGFLWTKVWQRQAARPIQEPHHEAVRRQHAVLIWVFMAVSVVAWLKTSANGRYAVPILLLLGPAIYLAASQAFGTTAGRLVSLMALALQVFLVSLAPNPRWNPQPWSSEWLAVTDPPIELTQRPALIVSVGQSSSSHMVSRVHPDSVFVNPIGLISIPTGGAGWSRFEALRQRYAADIWVLTAVPPRPQAALYEARLTRVNSMIDRLQLTFDPQRCVTVTVNAGTPQPAWLPPRKESTELLALCPAALKTAPDLELAAAREKAERIMDAAEARCPQVFQPRRPQVEGVGTVWTRLYGRFDLNLSLELPDGQIVMRQDRQATPVILGNVATWEQDIARIECQLPHKGSRGIDTLKVSYAQP